MTLTKQTHIGFIGLGAMGSGIAMNIAKAGFPLMVYDINPELARNFAKTSQIASKAEELYNFGDVFLLSLPGSPEVKKTLYEFMNSKPHGKIVIDLSTSFPTSTQALYRELKNFECFLLDAPLAGGPLNASDGTLTTMVGGDTEKFQECKPLFESFAKNIIHMGPTGSGHTAKLAGNYLSILYCVLYSEILPLLEKLGIDCNKFIELIKVSGANSPIFQAVAPKIVNKTFEMSFRMALGEKDLSYAKKLFEQEEMSSLMLNSGIKLFENARSLCMETKDISELARLANYDNEIKAKDTRKDM